jgi:phage gp46-like protein
VIDYTLIPNGDGNGADMSYEKATGIMNNIYLSLTVRQGTWFLDPLFGLRDRGRMKLTDRSERLLRADCLEALQWLLDSGRAKSIEVTTERDRSNLNRLRVLVEAVQVDGTRVTFDKFIEVV